MARRAIFGFVFSLSLVLVSCTSYQSAGATGGFSETQLNATTYQVRFKGNGYTSKERTSQFLLRRAAELTLERGYRYFVISGLDDLSRDDFWGNYPMQQATVRFVASMAEDPQAADAALIIRQTDELAGGRLSPAARTALDAIVE